MNYLIFIIKSAIDDFVRNKVRTFLTSLGILIGVASVVILIAFGLGLKKYISDQFEALGTNLIIILPGKLFSNGKFRQGGSAATTVQFEEKDINLLKKIRTASYIVPVFTKTSTLEAGNNTELSDILFQLPIFFQCAILWLLMAEYMTKVTWKNGPKWRWRFWWTRSRFFYLSPLHLGN